MRKRGITCLDGADAPGIAGGYALEELEFIKWRRQLDAHTQREMNVALFAGVDGFAA